MSESIFSPSWYRVAKLRPRLRGHAHVHRHEYRGEIWYVLQDHAKNRYYRFTPAAYHVIGQMNGKRTVQDLWERAADRFGDDAPTQGEVIQLLGQLHSADILLCDVPPDTAELLGRSEKIGKAQWKMKLRSPLAIRIPLWDPERFLSRTLPLVRPIISVWGALLWLGVVVTGIVLAGQHWGELTENIVDRVLAAQNLVILWFVYPVIKAFHELGHGYTVKRWGGEVHELGIMFLVFMPVPYVDASAASEFRAKHRRVLVGAAGIVVEVFLAALALILWTTLEPGLARSVAYNAVLIGGVSTVLFNGNPLLRFDGYYIFSDLIDMPNLAQRGYRYLGFQFRSRVLGVRSERPPYAGPGERFWFVFYSIAAFIYRIFVYTGIVLFVAGKFFFIGVLLAFWAIFNMAVNPVIKALKYLVTSPQLRAGRPRAVLVAGVLVSFLVGLLFLLPVPFRTRTEGIVWVPEEGLVRAGANGFIDRLAVPPDASVEADQLLMECRDPLLTAEVAVLQAGLEELQARLDAARTTDQVQVRIIEEELRELQARMDRARERLAELAIRSPSAGRLVMPAAGDLPGRHVQQGQLVGYVLDRSRPTIRVVVPQSRADLVRLHSRSVEVRLAERPAEVRAAEVRREVPGAEDELPSPALGQAGGGSIPVDPFGQDGMRAFQGLFHFDVELLEPGDASYIGSRAWVLFDHGRRPLAWQWYRSLRQLFLRRFNV